MQYLGTLNIANSHTQQENKNKIQEIYTDIIVQP